MSFIYVSKFAYCIESRSNVSQVKFRLESVETMNWVGGVRSRLKVKNERKRQQDFFEKKKFSSKVKKLETAGSPSERKQAISLDLVSLQAANFSAAHFKKNGSGIRSSGRIKRVDLDKSRGLFRQKFVNLPDASPETKPSALNLSQPSTQKSVSCPKLHPTSRTHTLTTITEDNAPTVADISNQDLFQTLTDQKEQSHFWTSTPANFWHKKKRPDRHKSISSGQVNDHYTVKKEPAFRSPSTSEKILLDYSREQMGVLDEVECLAGKTPGSCTSGWSDLSTIMEDTDEATVPSIDDDNDWEHHVRNNKVSSQSNNESVHSLDVPTSQWTLQMADEEPLSNDPDSTLSSFKDCHKMEYPARGSHSRDTTKLVQHPTTKEEYSCSNKMKMECQVKNQPSCEHTGTMSQPSNTLQASNEVPLRVFTADAALMRDQHIVPKVRKDLYVVDEQQTIYHSRNADHQSEVQAHYGSMSRQYADMEEQRDLACHESSSFTSPEDSGTYLMTERSKLDKYRQHPSQHDSEPSQRQHMHKETLWQCPTPEKGKDARAVLGQTSPQEFRSAMYYSSYVHNQVKNMDQNAAVVKKFTKRQMSGDQGTNVDIMNLYSSRTKQTASADDERRKVTVPIHLSCKPQSVLTQIQGSNEASLVHNQDDDKSSSGAPDDESVISDKDDAESSGSSDCSMDNSPDMDLLTETDASSIDNWLKFVHDAQGMNKAEQEKPTELQGVGCLVKDVPATAQQMLEEVLALDRELQKETFTEDKDEVRERTSILVSGRDRSVEKLCDSSQAKDIPQEVHDITSPRTELKTLLRTIPRNAKPEDAVKEQLHEVQGIDMESKHGLNIEVTVGSKVDFPHTEETAATLPPEKSEDKMTKPMCEDAKSSACETSSFQMDLTSQMDVISTTVAIIDDDPGKMPSVVSTSSGTGTDADSMTIGEKVLCDQSVQCTLIGDPLPMPQGRGGLKDGESQDINMSSHDIVMIESSTCDSIANTQSSHENDFESCVSTP